MYDRVLKRMRDCIRLLNYIMTIHAEEEMANDGFSVLDVENGILTGSIDERQRDQKSKESKYLVRGLAQDGRKIMIVAKMTPTGKLAMITVYALED